MTVELTKDGLLKVQAENELEVYALKKWLQDNNIVFTDPVLSKSISILPELLYEYAQGYRGR
jgi:hypothetical protein